MAIFHQWFLNIFSLLNGKQYLQVKSLNDVHCAKFNWTNFVRQSSLRKCCWSGGKIDSGDSEVANERHPRPNVNDIAPIKARFASQSPFLRWFDHKFWVLDFFINVKVEIWQIKLEMCEWGFLSALIGSNVHHVESCWSLWQSRF